MEIEVIENSSIPKNDPNDVYLSDKFVMAGMEDAKKVVKKDFTEWCKEVVKLPAFRKLVIESAKKNHQVLTKIIEYGSGKPATAIANPGALVVVWQGDKPTPEVQGSPQSEVKKTKLPYIPVERQLKSGSSNTV